jgi:uncharacterized protein YifN (PemK superfamily)
VIFVRAKHCRKFDCKQAKIFFHLPKIQQLMECDYGKFTLHNERKTPTELMKIIAQK